MFYLAGAVAFFVCYEIYMVIMTWYSLEEKKVGFSSLRTKEVCSITGAIALLLYAVLGKSFFVLADLKKHFLCRQHQLTLKKTDCT